MAQHRWKTTPHPSKETYQTNGTIFSIFSEFFPEKDMDIPRPTTPFTSPARSIIHKKRTKWIVPIFAKHFGKESVTLICHRDGAGSSTKPQGHMVKKGRKKLKSSKPQSKSAGYLKRHSSLHLQGTLTKEMGGPMPPLDHKASDIHRRETNPGEKG